MSQLHRRVNLHDLGFEDAVTSIHDHIVKLVEDLKTRQELRRLFLAKSPTKSLSKRRFDLQRNKGYSSVIVVAELTAATAESLLSGFGPDGCALRIIEQLKRYHYGDGIRVYHQQIGSAKNEGEPVSLFIGLSSEGKVNKDNFKNHEFGGQKYHNTVSRGLQNLS